MWTCAKCKEKLEDQFGACWNCGTSREGSPPAQEFEGEVPEPEELEPQNTVSYDASVINRFADMLYSRADLLVVLHAIAGCVIGAAVGFFLGSLQRSDVAAGVAVVGGGIGLVVGIWVGETRAFWYRLTAQLALCQVEIEKNTRRTGGKRG